MDRLRLRAGHASAAHAGDSALPDHDAEIGSLILEQDDEAAMRKRENDPMKPSHRTGVPEGWLPSALGRMTLWSAFVVIVAVMASLCFWDWMTANESGSATVRNLALAVAAAIGLPLAIWRSSIAERQVTAAFRQLDTAAQSLSDERFKTGIELLGHEDMTIRVGGVYVLADRARRQPESYHVRTMEIFAAFLAYPPRHSGGDRDGQIDPGSADTTGIVGAIESRTPEQERVEAHADFHLEQKLNGTHFPLEQGRIRFVGEPPRPPSLRFGPSGRQPSSPPAR